MQQPTFDALSDSALKVARHLCDVAQPKACVVLFQLETPPEQFRAFENCLSKVELARADKFITDQLRRRFVICRGALRVLLGNLVKTEPSEVKFDQGRWGKPSLSGRSQPSLHFNVSNSADQAAIGFASTPLGIDLECLSPRFRHRTIQSQVLSEEEADGWSKIDPRHRDLEMMRLWVCKEALLKAMGLGIAEGLQLTSFPLPIPSDSKFTPSAISSTLQVHLDDDGTCRSNHFTDASSWQMRLIEPGPQKVAAVATSHRVKEIVNIA